MRPFLSRFLPKRPVSTLGNLVARPGMFACSSIENKRSDWLSLILVAKKVELGSISRTGRAFASKRSFSPWISSYVCPDSLSLGRAAEFAERDRLLANVRSVLEVESSSTFLRPE